MVAKMTLLLRTVCSSRCAVVRISISGISCSVIVESKAVIGLPARTPAETLGWMTRDEEGFDRRNILQAVNQFRFRYYSW